MSVSNRRRDEICMDAFDLVYSELAVLVAIAAYDAAFAGKAVSRQELTELLSVEEGFDCDWQHRVLEAKRCIDRVGRSADTRYVLTARGRAKVHGWRGLTMPAKQGNAAE